MAASRAVRASVEFGIVATGPILSPHWLERVNAVWRAQQSIRKVVGVELVPWDREIDRGTQARAVGGSADGDESIETRLEIDVGDKPAAR